MPFDGRNFQSPGRTPFDSFVTSQPEHGFEMAAMRPNTQNSPLFGLDGREWSGFFLGLTGAMGLALGLAALLLSFIGD